MVVASNSGENGWRQREPSQGDARRPPPKGFELRRLRRNPKADVDSAFPSKKQRHSRGEMRSEHNRGASLAAFLLAVSTMTLLFVSPVEGQGAPCTTNVDCLSDPSEPYCVIPDGAPSGECSAFAISLRIRLMRPGRAQSLRTAFSTALRTAFSDCSQHVARAVTLSLNSALLQGRTVNNC